MSESDFALYSFAVITLSDKGSRGEREDTSGEHIKTVLSEAGCRLEEYRIIPDRKELIVETLCDLCDNRKIPLIITTGGTGLSPTDVTPEAMNEVIEKEIPGMAEAMRAASMLKTSRAMLSRGKVGIRGQSLIINLPGSLKAARENLEVVMPVLTHALEKMLGGTADCGTN